MKRITPNIKKVSNSTIIFALIIITALIGLYFYIYKSQILEEKSFISFTNNVDQNITSINSAQGKLNTNIPSINKSNVELSKLNTNKLSINKLSAEYDKPNIIIINIDSLRADHMGIYGYKKNITPFLDSFFLKGIIFDNAITPAPFTFQTDASIFTSLYPSQNGVHTWRTPINNQTVKVFLQQILKENGYNTAAFVSPSLYKQSGMFEYFDNYELNGNMKNVNESRRRVIDWISNNNEEPYYVFWHIYDVHIPYKNPPKEFYQNNYTGVFFTLNHSSFVWTAQKNTSIEFQIASKININSLNQKDINFNNSTGNYIFKQDDINYLKASYDYGIKTTDEELKLFFDDLIALDDLENTIIIISAEHGEDLKEHGYFFHSDLYDVNTRVPFMILYPNNKPARIKEPVSSLDIMPTIINLINETPLENIEGKNLIPLINGESLNRAIFSERPPFGEYSIRTDKWKYILRNPTLKSKEYLAYIKSIDSINPYFFYNIALYDNRKEDELYDLTLDPYEQNNLVGKGYPIEKELKEQIDAFKIKMTAAKDKNQIGFDLIGANVHIFYNNTLSSK